MTDFINNLSIAAASISVVGALSSIAGYCLSYSLKKRGYALDKGSIVYIKDRKAKKSYLLVMKQYPPEMKTNFTNNPVLQDYNTRLENLEGIPSGHVRKLFLSGRGSWRVTCGNIFTRAGFDRLAEKEYSQML